MTPDDRTDRLVTRYSLIFWCFMGVGAVSFVVGARLHIRALSSLLWLGFALGAMTMAALFARRPQGEGGRHRRHPADITAAIGWALVAISALGLLVLSLLSAPGVLRPGEATITLAVLALGIVGLVLLILAIGYAVEAARKQGRGPSENS